MPLYEYTCRDCGDGFEMLVRAADTPTCPSCRSVNLDRALSMFAVGSAERSSAALAAARKQYRQGRDRQDRLRHESDSVREHLKEDHGIDLPRKREETS